MSVAIIGNSPNLLQSGYGPEIDSHDIVIRCNKFELVGYELHTGGKTDYVVSNCHVLNESIQKKLMVVSKDIDISGENVISFVNQTGSFAREHGLSMGTTTAGTCAVLFANEYLKEKEIHCYGFTRNYTGICKHYFEETVLGIVDKPLSHNHVKELDLMEKIFGVIIHD
tara:strand:+ start:1946 stop:2452 length:507 start_codon:yes stop_codon:yes gene_type:complete